MRKLKFSDAGDFTANPPTVAGTSIGKIQGAALADAEFIRLPRPRERCPLTGLSRTTLIELLEAGQIRGLTIRRPGAIRGIRLIVKASLLSHLYDLAGQQQCEK